jgi:uncharacterized protein (TIGR02147 family)
MKTIYNYLDYRKYLSDAVNERKRQNRHFSFRFMSRHLDLKSSAFMHLVMSGKKKLPDPLVPKIAALLKLDEQEGEYLSIMVKFNHSINSVERDELFRKLEGFVKKNKAHHVPPEQYRVFTQWFYVAIRELLRIVRFKDNFHFLASSLQPKIKNKEARAAIQTLEKIGLIARGDDGYFKPLDSQITTGEVWESELIKSLQIQFAEMGKNAIITVPKQKRDISNLTICASEETVRLIGKEIAALRQKILALSDNDPKANAIYQCNLQVFPVSREIKGEAQ